MQRIHEQVSVTKVQRPLNQTILLKCYNQIISINNVTTNQTCPDNMISQHDQTTGPDYMTRHNEESAKREDIGFASTSFAL